MALTEYTGGQVIDRSFLRKRQDLWYSLPERKYRVSYAI